MVSRTLEGIMKALKVLGAVCLVGMTLLTFIDVVGRYFGHPVFGSVEMVGFMATLAVAMALPYTHHVQGHIGVEILVRLLPERARVLIDVVTGLLGLTLFAIVTWQMTLYASDMRASGEVSISLELPEYVVIYAVAFCLLIFTGIIVINIVNNIKRLRAK
jgi:TRAP-type C4-dicarboxylate transport system permease small subunit